MRMARFELGSTSRPRRRSYATAITRALTSGRNGVARSGSTAGKGRRLPETAVSGLATDRHRVREEEKGMKRCVAESGRQAPYSSSLGANVSLTSLHYTHPSSISLPHPQTVQVNFLSDGPSFLDFPTQSSPFASSSPPSMFIPYRISSPPFW
jgi:hypothetical protein